LESNGEGAKMAGEPLNAPTDEPVGAPTPEPRLERIPAADGVSLAVRIFEPDRGAAVGDPFVLLHGIASTSVGWEEAARLLAAAGRMAYAVDMRGHGLSDRPDEGYDLTTLASDLGAVIGGLGLERPILVGHSLGASVVLEAVAIGRVRASGVGLVEGGLTDARDQFATPEECVARTALPPVAGMPESVLAGYLREANPGWSQARLAAALAALDVKEDGTLAWRLTPPRYASLLAALWIARAADKWPAVRVPTLVVAVDTGDAPWTAAKRTAEVAMKAAIPGIRVEWLMEDHDVQTAQPEAVAALLLDAFGI